MEKSYTRRQDDDEPENKVYVPFWFRPGCIGIVSVLCLKIDISIIIDGVRQKDSGMIEGAIAMLLAQAAWWVYAAWWNRRNTNLPVPVKEKTPPL